MFSRDVYYENGKIYKSYREVNNYRDKAFNDKWAGKETDGNTIKDILVLQ